MSEHSLRSHPQSSAPIPRVLSIAGTDPSGGAGLSADLKSIAAAGGYGMGVVTVLVAQNTHGVRSLHQPPLEFLADQLTSVSDDVVIDAVKTGMLGTAAIIGEVERWLDANPPRILVVDPVMVATSGDRLLDADAEQAMLTFCTRATVVTPNIGELAVLVGQEPATTEGEAIEQARAWAKQHQVAVVVKTGHLDGPMASNTWVSPDGDATTIPAWRIVTQGTHGTGCSLSSALATRLALEPPVAALTWATRWLNEAIEQGDALQVGTGNGPVDHGHQARRLVHAADTTPWLTPGSVPAAWHEPGDLQASDRLDEMSECPPAGPWTAALWSASAPIVHEMLAGRFVHQLGAGTLEGAVFDSYLAQDTLYLIDYARALAVLGAKSTLSEEIAQWSKAAVYIQETEAAMHRDWLTGPLPSPSPVTAAYTTFLLANAAIEPLVVGAAAALPCPWLYALAGTVLPEPGPEHPYRTWLATYNDEGFFAQTNAMVAVVERLLAQASPEERAAAARAYLLACRHEVEFFDQALRALNLPLAGASS